MNTSAPPDTLYLWYLGHPAAPVLVGELNLVMNRRSVSLRYAAPWLAHGFALSEDLPLVDVEHFPRQKDEAVGAVELCTIPQPSFAATLRASPLFSERLLAMMARELRVSEEQTLALAHETVRARTVRLLLGFLDDTGAGQAPGDPILVPLQRWELAQMVSTSPETPYSTMARRSRSRT